jgi:hypothetical protein
MQDGTYLALALALALALTGSGEGEVNDLRVIRRKPER